MKSKSEIFNKLGEYYAAGFFEEENAPYNARFARAIVRHFEYAPEPQQEGYCRLHGVQALWKLNGYRLVNYDYNSGFSINSSAFEQARQGLSSFECNLLDSARGELEFCHRHLIPPRYCIGGEGWIHCIPNYERVLADGLIGYRDRLAAKPDNEFYRPLKEVINALIAFFSRCGGILGQVPVHPARNFQEALVALTAIWYLDGCDSFGRLDNVLGKYYSGEAWAKDAMSEFFRLTDINNAWHMYLADQPQYHNFTMLCIKAQNGIRRPNTGIRISTETSQETWQTIFDAWAQGNPTPSLYNDAIYRAALPKMTGVSTEDLDHYAMGGCTETMFEGRSQVGSIDAGINLLEIYMHSKSYESFLDDVRRHIKAACNAVVQNHKFTALYRPAIIRTLFVDDCIDNGRDFRDCGARYNGSVINVAGGTDTVNAIAAARGIKGVFGEDNKDIDAIAKELYNFVFNEISSSRTYGYCLPSIILFETYANLGKSLPASAGRKDDGEALADSAGAHQGTDTKGPTALMNSVLSLPAGQAIGTTILNLRLPKNLLNGNEMREVVKALITGFFRRGGMQLQVTVVDSETLRKAYDNPQDYPNLIVRIGGYSVYFAALSRDLQTEVLKRTEQTIVT